LIRSRLVSLDDSLFIGFPISRIVALPQLYSRSHLNISIAGEETINDNVTARIYSPKDLSANLEETKLPVCVYYHGGGWLSGTLDSEDPECRIIARDTPCVVVSLTYRLVPKYQMPIPIDDAVIGYEWVSTFTLGNDSRLHALTLVLQGI
jgi:acetyl esterase/lipase